MGENEYQALITIALTIAGILFGSYQSSNLWKSKAKSVTRKECRGRLYWIVEDGDLEKLKHINTCFDNEAGGS